MKGVELHDAAVSLLVIYALDAKCGQRHVPPALHPEKRTSTIPTGMGGPQGRSGWGEESLSLPPPIEIPSPERATCGVSPYRLSCRGLLLQKDLNCIVFSASSFVIFFPWIRILRSPEK